MEVVDGLQPALDMFLAALDSLLAAGPFEDSDLVGEDSPLAGKGNLEVEADVHLVQEDILQVVADSFLVVADSSQAVAGSLQVEESRLQAVVGNLQAEKGNLQAVVGNLQAVVGILQAVEGNLQEEQNLQGLGRAYVQSRPFPHWSGPLLSLVVTQ